MRFGKAALVLSGAALVATGIVGGAVYAKTADEAPGIVEIKGCRKKKPPVEYKHEKHVDRTTPAGKCDTCHHTQKGLAAGDDSVEVKPCTGCHRGQDADATTAADCRSPSTKKNPFHIRCITCHKSHNEESGKAKAPTGCKGGCHVE